MSQPAQASTTRWVTAAALRALAERTIVGGGMFTADQLGEWTRETLTPEQRVHASTRLCALGLVKHDVRIISGQRTDCYTVTDDGNAAISAAALGIVHKSGPKGGIGGGGRKPNPVKPEALATRLWHLVRVRKVVDSDSCARTLCTAGDEEFERVRATVRRTLRRWELAGALQAGSRLVKRRDDPITSNGNKRYVLVQDSGPTPPAWRQALKAQGVSA